MQSGTALTVCCCQPWSVSCACAGFGLGCCSCRLFVALRQRTPDVPTLMVIALPLLGFTFARWAMPSLAERRDFRRTNQVRRNIAASGFAVILFMLWLRFLQQDFGLWDLRWLLAAGYDLIYWDAIPIEIPGTLLSYSWASFSGCAARWMVMANIAMKRFGRHFSGAAPRWPCLPGSCLRASRAASLARPQTRSAPLADSFQIPFGCCYLCCRGTGGAGRCQPQEIRWLAAQFTRGQSESQPQLACRHRPDDFCSARRCPADRTDNPREDAAVLWRALG